MDSEIIELNNKNEEFNDFDSEIDPFASEKGDSSSEINEIQGQFIKIHVPMVSSNAILVEISVTITIAELLEKLKEEEAAIFDSNGKFNGRIYCNKQLVKNETEAIQEESDEIILIHNLISEDIIEEEEKEEEIVKKTRTKTTLMSRFRNFWTGKEKEKQPPIEINETTTIVTANGEIPEFIEDVLNYLRRDEMIQEGLFRLSGTFTRIKTLQDRLNCGEKFRDFNLTASDCHNVTSLLKQFLRNLPEPLLTFELYEAWQTLGQWTSQPEIAVKIGNFLVNQLPKMNKKILEELMEFLNERLEDSETTRMNACNYGTVIGPNLLWHPQEDRQMRGSTTLGLSLQSSTLASQICTLFLQNYKEIFEMNSLENDPVMAYGKTIYDYTIECDSDSESENCESEMCESDNCESEDENKESNDEICASTEGCEPDSTDESDDADSTNESDNINDVDKTSDTSNTTTNTTFNTTIASKTDENSEEIAAGQLIFIVRIEDLSDGWWLAHVSPSIENLSKFPSNYVQVLAQRSDEELIKIL